MILHSPQFEKDVRALHRAELRANPELLKQHQAQRKPDNQGRSETLRQFFVPIFWVAIGGGLLLKDGSVPLAMAVLSLWTAGSAFLWAQRWFQQFYGSGDLLVLSLLPLNDRQIFRFQNSRFLKRFAFVLWELILAYGTVALFPEKDRPPFFLLFAAVLAQAGLILALLFHLARFLHSFPLALIGGLFRTTAIVVLLWGVNTSKELEALVTFAHWIFPTGWLNYLLVQSTVGRDLVTLVLLAPLAALVLASRTSWATLRGLYSLEHFELAPAPTAGLPGDHEELTPEAIPRRGPTEIEDNIASRSFLLGVNWEGAGWLEKLVGKFLNARQRLVAEFLVASNPGWSRGLRFAFFLWAAASLVVLLFGQHGGTIVFFAAYLLVTGTIPLFGGDWRGLRQAPTGNVFLPVYSVFPITFNEMAGTLLKVNVVRISATFPMLLAFAALAAYKLGHSPWRGAAIAFQVLGLLGALQPLLVLFPISKSTNDTARMKGVWWLVFLPLILVLLGAGIAIFFVSNPVTLLAIYGGILLVSGLFFVIYRRMYRLSKFDLLNERSS